MLLLLTLACAEVTQTPACAQYVACVEAKDAAAGTTTDLVRFQPQGECWGSPAGADLCDRACVNGLEFERSRTTDAPDACAP